MPDLTQNEEFLSGGGEMGALIRSIDWSKTALGPVENWPQSLRTTVSLCLSSTFPILIAWGEDMVQIYNDSYRPICGAKHPQSMGQNFKICWETALPVVGDKFDRGWAGEGTYIKDQQMLLDRFGYIEEAFMTFSFAPIRDESGQVGGIFHPITETTDKMLSARRTQVLRSVSTLTTEAKSIEQICEQLLAAQPEYTYDIPFIQIYKLNETHTSASLLGSAGISVGGSDIQQAETLLSGDPVGCWPFEKVLETGQPYVVTDLAERFSSFQSGPFENAPHSAITFPIHIAGQQSAFGFLVTAVSSARMLDEEYMSFFELLSNTVNTAFSNVHAYQMEQKRAEELAEIDKAKTAFFSNVSHEFRTPLTLILGPLQEMLTQPALQNAAFREPLESVHSNAMRLLKLVNNLLDFSRMEAGRVKATFRPVDLSELTVDLASNFRSVVEKAGMSLIIDCPKPRRLTYVDIEMWEKIVLNLLSNAFKYTLEGSITVQLLEESEEIILNVTDTGVGIPAHELPHMFERFHRVENAFGRTHEGTGIGLSLVSELVRLHQGQVSVSSTEGRGSTFTIRIPAGKDHLAPAQIVDTPLQNIAAFTKGAYLKEAMSLLGENDNPMGDEPAETYDNADQYIQVQKNIRILLVDDNADMRQYLHRLLLPYYTLEVAVHGEDAIGKTHKNKPDLIVSDIMMPVMDGLQMLKRIRAEFPFERIPVIFLSARAGEEARIDGIEAGADDYLVKPFSARELLAKVNAQIKISESRKQSDVRLNELFLKAPVAIGIFSGPQLIVELANSMMLRYWGLTTGQVLGRPYYEIFETVPGDGFDAVVANVMKTGKRQTLREYKLEVVRNGEVRKIFLNLMIESLSAESDSPGKVMVVANDVTELVLSFEQLKESQERFRVLANNIPHLVWTIDSALQLDFVNEFVTVYSGLTNNEVKSRGLRELIHADEQEINRKNWEAALGSGTDFVLEHRFRRHDGEYRWHLTRVVPKRNLKGEVQLWIGTSTDIHEQKTIEENLEQHVASRTAELNELNKTLIKTNRELERFAYVSSHDLQEPLRKIQVFSDLISKELDDPEKNIRHYLERINASARRMSTLIADLLSYSRVANERHNLVPTDLNKIVREVLSDFELVIQQKGAVLKTDDLPEIAAVPTQINQLFYNLIGNSLKFTTHDPRIEITHDYLTDQEIGRLALPADVSYLRISVSDNGLGFDQKYADQIFTLFQRLHSQESFAGTGIGLAICQRVVENHNGLIKAYSEPGKGSRFEIILPVVV